MADFKKLIQNRNIGKIVVDLFILDKFPNEVQRVLSKLLIKSVTLDPVRLQMAFIGYGECFKTISSEQVIPTYDVIFKFDDDNALQEYELKEVGSNKYC